MKQTILVRYFVVALILLVCLSLDVSATTITTFNNSLASETLTFTGNQNITRFLAVPSSISFLTDGWINISGWRSGSYIFTNNSVYYYDMQEVSGPLLDKNGTHNAQIGTLNQRVVGKIGQGLSLNKTGSSFARVNETTYLADQQAAYSISFWIKSVMDAEGDIYSEGSSSSAVPFFSIRSSNAVTLSYNHLRIVNRDDSSVVSSNELDGIVLDGTWHHIVFTNANGNYKYYVDGHLNDSGSYTKGTKTVDEATIGRLVRNTFEPIGFNGTVDEFGVWNRILSASEVSGLYNAGLGLAYINTSLNNTSLKIGNADNPLNISANATFPANQSLTGLAPDINAYLTGCTIISGFCNVPFVFHSDIPGTIGYFDMAFINTAFVENSQTYNSNTYETAQENFAINITYDSAGFPAIAANLIYDGVSYSSTRIGTGNNAVFTSSINIPTIASATNKTFYWSIQLTDTLGGVTLTNSTSHNQTVYPIALSWCGTTNPGLPYINFTFRDQQTLAFLNGSTDSSVWTYYLGSGSVTKSLTYINSSGIPSWAFCFNPQNRSMITSYSYTYSSSGYPSRTFSQSAATLTNATTNQTLYLLSSAAGVEQPVIVTNSMQIPVSGALVTVSTLVGGVPTVVGQTTTDSAGVATFWLEVGKQHTVTVEVTGCTTFTGTLTPGNQPYSAIMGGCGASIQNVSYNFSTQGMKWKIFPASGQLSNTATGFTCSQTFGFNLTAELGNLVSCKLEIITTNGTVLSTVTGVTNSTTCALSTLYVSPDVSRLKGRASIMTTSSGGAYFVLDDDAYWICLDTNSSSFGTIRSFFTDMRNLPQFGGNEMRQEYSRIVFFFLLITILIGIFTFLTGYELNNPGAAMGILVPIIAIAGLSGWFQMQLSTVKYQGAYITFANTHLVWVMAVLLGLTFLANYFRKAG